MSVQVKPQTVKGNMNYAELVRIDELLDAHGTIYHAVESRKAVIARRLSEGKSSPRAEAELAALLALPLDYRTRKQTESDKSNAEYIRNTQGVD